MSYIKISEQNLVHNLGVISKRCGIGKIAAVLKDNAYGHGLLECAQICAKTGVKYAVVRANAEAEVVSGLFEMVVVLADVKNPKNSNTHIVINRISDINKLASGTNIHLKIDSGMHRNGVDITQIEEAMSQIKQQGLSLRGVMTHLRSADELSTETFWQTKNFQKAVEIVMDFCAENSLPKPMVHMHNSAGVFSRDSFEAVDMVRVGIAMYGYMDMPSSYEKADLRPVMSLYTDKISTKVANTNQRPGYGGAGFAPKGTKSSVYDVGYADGFFRISEKQCCVLPDGSRIIGRVSMDNMIIDSEADSVCLFEDARELARLNNTITYDVFVKLSPKIPRILS